MKEGFIQNYLRSRVVSKTSLYGLFRKLEQYEINFHKDCSLLTKEEILQIFTDIKSRSIYTLLNNVVILKAYCRYIQYYHKIKVTNAYEELTIEDLRPCVNKKASRLLSRDEVTEIEDNLLNYTDAAIVECLFSGIAGDSMCDITSLDKNMLDKENKCLVFPDGRVFDITDRLIDLLEKAFDEEDYLCYGETLRVKKLIGKGKLFKDRDNAHAADSDDRRFRAVYRKIQLAREHVGIKELTMKTLTSSGFLYWLQQGMQQTGLELKQFLKTEVGERLMDRYGYNSEFRVDNVFHRYRQYI